MRVNVYAEEMTRRVEIVEKNGFTGLRLYLHLPVSFHRDGARLIPADVVDTNQAEHLQAPFMHHPGDDDSSAVTFWGKTDLREVLKIMEAKLNDFYAAREHAANQAAAQPAAEQADGQH